MNQVSEEYKIVTSKDYPNQYELQTEIEWPEFMYHDPVSNRLWKSLFETFTDFQFSIFQEDNALGYANSIPLHIDNNNLNSLDDRGWDWALEKGFTDKQDGREPNALCGLQIGINKQFQSKGISYRLIEGMRKIAKEHHFKHLVLPVRPNMKCYYPLISMEDYITWKNDEGMPFDPWIRAHTKLGAKIVKVCNHAMYIPGTITEWQEWTGLSMQTSGDYIITGALSPVKVSVENNIAEYFEPNVWMVHNLSSEIE